MSEARELGPHVWMQTQLDIVAKELQRAAQHTQRAAQHHAEGDVPRGSAHILAAQGHILTATQILQDVVIFHANRSVPDE